MNLEIDLYSDWIGLLRSELALLQYPVPQVSDPHEIAFLYHSVLLRLVPQKPRAVRKSKGFVCPSELETGLLQLECKVTQGSDINPHLSRKITQLAFQDALLNDWGIHHFHLGTNMLPSGLVEGTSLVLFARVTDSDFFEICIAGHGTWAEVEMVESLHENWPESIRHFRLQGQGVAGMPTTSKSVEFARSHGLHMPITTIDGTRYAPVGGGIASDGSSVAALENADREAYGIKHLQEDIVNNLGKIKEELGKRGYTEGKPIRAKLVLDNRNFRVQFPDYNYFL